MKVIKNRSGKTSVDRVRRRIPIADDACPSCGSEMKEVRGTLRIPINGEEIAVSSSPHLRCPKCREVVLRLEQARRLNQDAIAIYRKKHGLLAAHEIRNIREHLGLTQAEFARLVHLGTNTISRWEAGRNVQTASMDILLRLIRDIPGSIDYLRKNAA